MRGSRTNSNTFHQIPARVIEADSARAVWGNATVSLQKANKRVQFGLPVDLLTPGIQGNIPRNPWLAMRPIIPVPWPGSIQSSSSSSWC